MRLCKGSAISLLWVQAPPAKKGIAGPVQGHHKRETFCETPLSQFDAFIAATAKQHSMTLITLDKNFKRIDKLKVILLKY